MPALNHTSPKYEPFAIPCVTAFATAAAQAAVSSVPYTAAAEDTAPPEALAAASTTVVALVKLEIVVTSLPPPEPAPVTTMILPASSTRSPSQHRGCACRRAWRRGSRAGPRRTAVRPQRQRG